MSNTTAASRQFRIQIRLQGQKIVTTPDRQSVRVGDELTWDCDHPWAVAFGGQGPFKDKDPDRRHNDHKDGHIRSNPGKEKITYKYAVAVSDGTDVYVADPEVIVDPDTEGG